MSEQTDYIYGRNAVLEALASGKEIEKIFISFNSQGETVKEVFNKARVAKVTCSKLDSRKFQRLEREVCPRDARTQGIIAQISLVEVLSVEDLIKKSFEKAENPFIIILDEITDPHNLGAIARSAECAGAGGIILPERNSAPVTPTAVKISAGALQHIPVAKSASLLRAFDVLREHDFTIIGTDISAKESYTDLIYEAPIAIVIGSEGKGMRPSLRKNCDELIKIPLAGKIGSLNASVSAGVIMFEILRQKTEAQSISGECSVSPE